MRVSPRSDRPNAVFILVTINGPVYLAPRRTLTQKPPHYHYGMYSIIHSLIHSSTQLFTYLLTHSLTTCVGMHTMTAILRSPTSPHSAVGVNHS